jgi:hypothetical protein
VCFAIGFVLAFTCLFAIIHEYGHILGTGSTIKATLKSWNSVSYQGEPTLGFLLAGWAFQWFVWYGAWGLNQYFSSCYPIILFDGAAGFAWGYVHGTTIQALRSQDFFDIQEKIGMPIGETRLAWLAFTIPMLLIGWLIVRKCLKNML